MKFYGHNLLWHTQQQQAYLKSLIAPRWCYPFRRQRHCQYHQL